MYKYIFFDLDGTLTDPGEGITKSVEYALNKYGIQVENRTSLYKFIGPPLTDSFRDFYDFSDERALEAVAYYREYFEKAGMFENKVYDGIVPGLEDLKKQGYSLLVATSKPEQYSVRILEHFNLLKYFDIVAGATMDGSRVRKADVITYALKKGNINDKSEVIMIGDRHHDIEGAKHNGLKSVGVIYGYGSREELEAAGADFIANTPLEVFEYIKGRR